MTKNALAKHRLRLVKYDDIENSEDRNMNKEWTEEERKALEAKYMAEFTAADLQEYTEDLEGVPFEEVLAKLEQRQRQLSEKNS